MVLVPSYLRLRDPDDPWDELAIRDDEEDWSLLARGMIELFPEYQDGMFVLPHE